MGCNTSAEVKEGNAPQERPAAAAAAAGGAGGEPPNAKSRVKKFDELEKEIHALHDKPAELDKLWARLDGNGNGKVLVPTAKRTKRKKEKKKKKKKERKKERIRNRFNPLPERKRRKKTGLIQ